MLPFTTLHSIFIIKVTKGKVTIKVNTIIFIRINDSRQNKTRHGLKMQVYFNYTNKIFWGVYTFQTQED